ncbi:MAG TPA: DUF1799 domain-containing protein [Xanthobacteraceae bacterium]|nr:DUF1799 domain-containing protein [Xanthobacteraceae bacterium]
MQLDDDMRRQFVALGVDLSTLPPEDTEEEHFEVWPPNWDALRLFLACSTQWRAAGTFARVIWLGLDYGAVEIVMRQLSLAGVAWNDLQAMEAAALGPLNSGTDA